jgi:hypothetical protein
VESVCTLEEQVITCVGGAVAGLGNDPVTAFLEGDVACETKSGANQPGGHIQGQPVTFTPRGGRTNLPVLTLGPAECPPGLVPIVGPDITLVILDEAGGTVFEADLTVTE